MKKEVIIGIIVLLFCCCFSVFGGFAAIGYFESNGQCVYKGPLATVSGGACAANPQEGNSNDDLDNNDTNNNQDDNSNGDDHENDGEDHSDLTYETFDYTLTYSHHLTLDDSNPNRVFLYSENGNDNLNITTSLSGIDVNQSSCEDYSASLLSELLAYDPEEESVDTTVLGGLDACVVDFTADYGTEFGRVSQRQYYINVNGISYYLTITINEDTSSFDELNEAALSFTLN